MGQPVVHFEIIGADGPALHRPYAQLFGWEINADNPMNYGIVAREGNVNADGVGIGGGVAGYEGVGKGEVSIPVGSRRGHRGDLVPIGAHLSLCAVSWYRSVAAFAPSCYGYRSVP